MIVTIAIIVDEHHWELGVEGSMGVVPAIYKDRKPEVDLWESGGEFDFADKFQLTRLFV